MRLEGLELMDPIFLSTLAGFLGDGHNGVPVDQRVAESLADIGLKVRKGGLLLANAVAGSSHQDPFWCAGRSLDHRFSRSLVRTRPATSLLWRLW
ncbi:hypothetical protein chiPu_0028823 [Chiloscyllium punctatum]|uniref:Uncharacterized protein n=1 Tax=Chiloscyllium punctatum TaxID=137246 RepID=A0A401TQW7_CHIPU|nr:hypothetical protein [Chiloscyllium punctatum]